MTDTSPTLTEAETWVSEYDEDTGQHRIYEAGELITCVGNASMDFNRQEDLAGMICTTLSRLRAGTHVLVPVEPTDQMTQEGFVKSVTRGSMADVYFAMITAAQEGK